MTLVIAMKCKGGMIMASDSEAVSISSGGPVRYDMRKIHKVGNSAVLGASGAMSVIQRSVNAAESFSKDLDSGMNPELREAMRDSLFPIFKKAAERHRSYYGEADGHPMADILICCENVSGEPRIWHLGKDANDEFMDQIGYAATGSGDVFAHTIFKSLYRRDMWLQEGALLAYKVIKDAMEVGAYGLGGPVDIWLIKDRKATRLTGRQMEMLDKAYKELHKAETGLLKTIRLDGLLGK